MSPRSMKNPSIHMLVVDYGWDLPLDPRRDFLYIFAERGLSYEEYLESR